MDSMSSPYRTSARETRPSGPPWRTWGRMFTRSMALLVLTGIVRWPCELRGIRGGSEFVLLFITLLAAGEYGPPDAAD
jgi:hypothetical protein